MDLTSDKVWKSGGIPFVVELRSEGVLEFVGVKCQGREPIKVLLVTVGKKESQNRERVDPSTVAYARLPRELTKPITFGFKSGTRPTPPESRHQLAKNGAQCYAELTACLEADVVVVVCDWVCESERWQHTSSVLGS